MTDGHGGTPSALCARCGVTREINRSRTPSPLCRDCRWVLEPEEQKAWAA